MPSNQAPAHEAVAPLGGQGGRGLDLRRVREGLDVGFDGGGEGRVATNDQRQSRSARTVQETPAATFRVLRAGLGSIS